MSDPSPAPVRLYYDYVDPLSRAVEGLVADAAGRLGVQVVRLPFEAVPPPAPLLDPSGTAWAERWAAARDVLGSSLPETPHPVVPWTRKAHELALHAGEHDRLEAVHEGLWAAYLGRGIDIGRVDVLVELAREAGLDPTEAKAVLDVDRWAGRVAGIREEAERQGVRGVPTLFVGGRRLEGLPPGDEVARLLSTPPPSRT